MRTITFLFVAFFTVNSYSQVFVNGVNLNEEVEMFELHAMKKPFSNKESFFIDYGQEKFRPHYYDHKTQAVYDAKGNKFKKGEYMDLYKYLIKNGWEKDTERETTLGNRKGRAILFIKKE